MLNLKGRSLYQVGKTMQLFGVGTTVIRFLRQNLCTTQGSAAGWPESFTIIFSSKSSNDTEPKLSSAASREHTGEKIKKPRIGACFG